MKRFSAVIIAHMVATVLPASAATNHSGSYHSVEAKSSWSDGQLPKGFSLTITVKFSGDKLTYHSANDTNKSKVVGLDFSAPLDGTPSPVANQSRYNQISVKKLGPDDLEILEMKDGDVIVGSFWSFAPDGKSFVRRGVGKDPAGKSKAFEEYFARQ
jgi:hypothetical protein